MTKSPIAGIGASVGGTFATLASRLDRLVTIGCSHAELSATAQFVTIAGQDNAPRVEAIAAICAARTLRYSVHAPIAINLMDETHAELHEAVLASSLRFAARIGARAVVIHPGRVHPQADLAARTRLLAVERDAVRRAADLAGAGGQVIAMENLNPNRNMMAGTMTSYALDPRALAAQIDAIDHPAVCGTLDFGHGWLAAGRLGFDYLAAVRDFAPFVGHLHVTDNCGMPITYVDATDDEHVAYGMGDLHLPIGWGSVPYDALLSDLPIRPGCAAVLELGGRFETELESTMAEVGRIADRLKG
jgi:sugar phosphate isomerase/epimerase